MKIHQRTNSGLLSQNWMSGRNKDRGWYSTWLDRRCWFLALQTVCGAFPRRNFNWSVYLFSSILGDHYYSGWLRIELGEK